MYEYFIGWMTKEIRMFNIFGNNSLDNYYERGNKRLDFEFSVDRLILEAWRDNIIDDKKLSSYDRYLLEFKFLDRGAKKLFGLHYNIVIYDENLDVVYDAQFKTFKALNSNNANRKGQMLLELEYWLSHDWKRD